MDRSNKSQKRQITQEVYISAELIAYGSSPRTTQLPHRHHKICFLTLFEIHLKKMAVPHKPKRLIKTLKIWNSKKKLSRGIAYRNI